MKAISFGQNKDFDKKIVNIHRTIDLKFLLDGRNKKQKKEQLIQEEAFPAIYTYQDRMK